MLKRSLLLGAILLLAACGGAAENKPASAPTAVGVQASEATLTPTTTQAGAGLPPPLQRRLQPGDLLLAAEIDDIPAIFAEDDLYVSVDAGSQEWLDEELVIGLEIAGDARAFPVRLLSLHEIVNDTIGGQPVAVTWCPLCFSAITYSRVVDGRALTFGVSGYLFDNNLVMYDHQTNTLWSQLLGQAIRGAQRGAHLQLVPSMMTSWGAWKQAHPDTLILSAARLGRRADEVVDPYGGYYTSGTAGLSGGDSVDERLRPKVLVVGLATGSSAKAYTLEALRERQLVNDVLDGQPLVLVYDAAFQTAVAYRRVVADQTLTFEPAAAGTLRDMETGSIWELRTGTAVDGPLAGRQLTRLAAPLVYWFAWSDYHPDSELLAP